MDDQNMRILCLSEDIPFISGGRITFFRMCRLIDRAIETELITCDGATELVLGKRKNETRIHIPKMRIVRYLLFQVVVLWKVLTNKKKYTAIFVNAGMTCWIAVLLGKLRGVKVVELHHDVITKPEIVQYSPSTSRIITGLIRYILMYAPLRFVDGIFAASRYTEVKLKKLYNKPIIFVGNPIR
jgi:hypothetical protein